MAIKIDFPSRTGGICKGAYVIVDLTLDNKSKQGRIELAVWLTEEYRRANAQKINNVCIPIGAEEAWYKKSEVIEGEVDLYPDNKVGDNLYITQLAFSGFMWKTGDEVYQKLKTLKVLVGDQIIDFSKAEDC